MRRFRIPAPCLEGPCGNVRPRVCSAIGSAFLWPRRAHILIESRTPSGIPVFPQRKRRGCGQSRGKRRQCGLAAASRRIAGTLLTPALPMPPARGFWKTELACKLFAISMVRKGGLEPPWIAPPDPKSGASANSATFAPSCSLDHSHFKFCLCVSAQHGFVAARNHSPAWIPQGAEGKIPCRCLHSTHSSNLHLNCRMNLEGGGTIRDAQGRPVGRAKPFRRSLPHADA